MKTTKKLTLNYTAEYQYYIKFLLNLFLIFSIGFMLLSFPETASQGISNGIDLCLGTLIPSLYPFTILSSLIVNLNITDFIESLSDWFSKLIFRLPGKCIGIIIMSLIGGYPIGAKMTKELYENGKLSQNDAQRLLLFCINPGPAFTISSIGCYMLGSKTAGIAIYTSVILSSLIIGILSRVLAQETEKIKKSSANEYNSFSEALVKSISNGTTVMLSICAWVCIFSCFNMLTEITSLSNEVKFTINCLSEVTNACMVACGNLPLPIIAGIIAFGGICTHFQIMSSISETKLKYKYFIVSRIIHGALSAFICNIIMKYVDISYEVFSAGTLPKKSPFSVSPAISILMFALCSMLLIGNSLNIKIKANKKAQDFT